MEHYWPPHQAWYCASSAYQQWHSSHYHASMVYAVIMCMPVCLSIRLSHTCIVSKRLNIQSHKQCHTIAQGF